MTEARQTLVCKGIELVDHGVELHVLRDQKEI